MQLQHSPDVTSVTADARPVKSVAADDTRAELERLNEELRRVRDRARKLLDVTTALSEARSVEDVTMVFLDKGLAVVEAARGVLVSVEGEKIRLLGSRGLSPGLEGKLAEVTLADEIPVVHALRKGEMVSIESAEEFRRLYASAYDGFGELADMQTYLATPLTHSGETIGAMWSRIVGRHGDSAGGSGPADGAPPGGRADPSESTRRGSGGGGGVPCGPSRITHRPRPAPRP